jgi:hypothetical protein
MTLLGKTIVRSKIQRGTTLRRKDANESPDDAGAAANAGRARRGQTTRDWSWRDRR